MSSLRSRLGWIAAVVVAAGLGVWAGRATFTPPATSADDAHPVLYTVAEDTVGRVQTFPAMASWNATPLLVGIASGTVTSIDVAAGDEVGPGDALYSVNLRPTILAEGTVPSFRDLAAGDTGTDVRQLEKFLADQQYLAASSVDGTCDAATTKAVRAWQQAVGFPVDGIVHLGDLAFAGPLPARVILADEVHVGFPAPTGVSVVSTLGDAPEFTVQLDPSQQGLVATSGPVTVTDDNGTAWEGVIASAATNNLAQLVLTLTAADGGPICGSDCGTVPATSGAAVYTAKIVAVEPATGPTVPAAALQTDASGAVYVQAAVGTRLPVTIRAQARGLAVVDGIDSGTEVRLVADEAAPVAGAPAPEESKAPPK